MRFGFFVFVNVSDRSLIPFSGICNVPATSSKKHKAEDDDGVVHVGLGDRHVVREDKDDGDKDCPQATIEHDGLGKLAHVERPSSNAHFFSVQGKCGDDDDVRPVGTDCAGGEDGVHSDGGAQVDQCQT